MRCGVRKEGVWGGVGAVGSREGGERVCGVGWMEGAWSGVKQGCVGGVEGGREVCRVCGGGVEGEIRRVCGVGWREKYAGCVGWGGGRADDLPLILHIEDQVIDVHCLSDQVYAPEDGGGGGERTGEGGRGRGRGGEDRGEEQCMHRDTRQEDMSTHHSPVSV